MTSPGLLIRIGELSRRTAVSADRLRAWERRYGLLRPHRTAGGFRLYSADDERRGRAMGGHLDAGLSAAEAAAAVMAADAEETGVAPAGAAAHRGRLLEALTRFEAPQAHALVDGVLAELGVDAALRTVILPVLHDIGERWADAELHVGQEHFARALIQARLLALLRAPGGGDGDGPAALLACAPGELHTLGLIGFGIALRNRGWRVTYLGADTPVAEVRRRAAQLGAAMTVVSAVMPARFADALAELRDLAAGVPLAVGGAGASG